MVRKTEKKSVKNVLSKENISPKIGKNSFNKTIQLNSTGDTDIIECSIINHENKCIKEIENKKTGISETKAKCKSLRKTESSIKSLSDVLRNSIRKSFGLKETGNHAENKSSPNTPCSNRKTEDPNIFMNKIISTLKKTPEVSSYLSKSKLFNIRQWLCNNEVEVVRTPPFANLSVTPRTSAQPKRKCETSKRKKEEHPPKDSSIDSEVEDVLKAVYGDDWKKNRNDKCKTEPGKKMNGVLPPKTNNFYSARRNILKGENRPVDLNDDEVADLDNSTVSGVKLINLDESNCSEGFIKSKKLNWVRKRKSDPELSSLESLSQTPAKKIKAAETAKIKKSAVKDSANKNLLKTPKKTFLASLSVSTPTSRCHPDAQYYKINFKSRKEELVKKLYKLYNGEVFEGKLADDMNFSWNVKLRGTAGFCHNKRITKSTGEIIRLSRIEFSTKIVDRADRLRDTMIHELCHAACWVIDGVLDGHGSVWTRWASKAMNRFPELPTIKRCHNYDIVSKYVYRCTGCGYSIKRHSKSIDVERKRCGHCFGVFELLLNKKKKGEGRLEEERGRMCECVC